MQALCGSLAVRSAGLAQLLSSSQEVLSATTWSARVRIPPRIADGPARVEVRAAGWRRRVAESAMAFRYFQPVGFGASGGNVRLATRRVVELRWGSALLGARPEFG